MQAAARVADGQVLYRELIWMYGPLSGDYQGYKEGDLPATEEMVQRLVFLPILSDPVPGAAEKVVEAIRRGAARARS